jgi:hypothetical protein
VRHVHDNDGFFHLAWKSRLDHWARQVNPLLQKIHWLLGMVYRQVIDQFEYNTEVLFRSAEHLTEHYTRLLDQDLAQHRRNRTAIGCRLQRLRVRRLVAKISRTRRWRVITLSTWVQLYYQGLATAA